MTIVTLCRAALVVAADAGSNGGPYPHPTVAFIGELLSCDDLVITYRVTKVWEHLARDPRDVAPAVVTVNTRYVVSTQEL